jgi:hypothetical protein
MKVREAEKHGAAIAPRTNKEDTQASMITI